MIVGMLLAAGPLCGNTVVQTQTYGPQFTAWGIDDHGAVNGTVALSFDKFDPSQGLLQSVSIKLDGSVTSDVFVANLSATATTITAQSRATLTLARPDLTTLVTAVPTNAVSKLLPAPAYSAAAGESPVGPNFFVDSSGNYWVGNGPNGNGNDDKINVASPSLSGPVGGGHNANTLWSLTTETSSSTANIADLRLFTGPGTISLPLGALGWSEFSDGANALRAIRLKASATVTLTYTYSSLSPGPLPVPEPASIVSGVMGVACCLVGISLRRRKGS